MAFAGMTATVAGTVFAATGRLNAVRYLDFTAVRVAGTALAVIGIGAVWVAQSGMGTSWRATVDYTERPELVTTGLFAVIRNPIFTFIIATAAGLALMAPNAVALAGVVAVALGIDLHVRRVEEPYLRWAHGDAYVRYAAEVGRFVPGVGRMRIDR
jgi:protein-S-isoprenylcysteine O-methyltransferase Ste14